MLLCGGDISEQTLKKYDSRDFMNGSPNRDVVVFGEALQLSVGERSAYLEHACGADAELRQRVERLLKAHDHAGDFLEHPPPEAVVEASSKVPFGETLGDR